jgi:hypothetical protein
MNRIELFGSVADFIEYDSQNETLYFDMMTFDGKRPELHHVQWRNFKAHQLYSGLSFGDRVIVIGANRTIENITKIVAKSVFKTERKSEDENVA